MIVGAISVVTHATTSSTPRCGWCSCWPAPRPSTCSLAAEFVAVTQVLVYIGAVMVLFLFGVMLTRAADRRARPTSTTRAGRSASRSPLLLLGVHVRTC